MTPQLDSMLRAIFRSPLQSRIVEDANRYLRDHETRDAPCKELSHFSEWNCVATSKLLETYKLPEVQRLFKSICPRFKQ